MEWDGILMQMMLYDEEEVPEARFAYNISPMSVLVRSEKRPFYDFMTKVLAIVGGTFSVVSLVGPVSRYKSFTRTQNRRPSVVFVCC